MGAYVGVIVPVMTQVESNETIRIKAMTMRKKRIALASMINSRRWNIK
jgi:hypothetical protein